MGLQVYAKLNRQTAVKHQTTRIITGLDLSNDSSNTLDAYRNTYVFRWSNYRPPSSRPSMVGWARNRGVLGRKSRLPNSWNIVRLRNREYPNWHPDSRRPLCVPASQITLSALCAGFFSAHIHKFQAQPIWPFTEPSILPHSVWRVHGEWYRSQLSATGAQRLLYPFPVWENVRPEAGRNTS